MYRCVADLSCQQLRNWMRCNHPVLMNIFKRKEYSWRHENSFQPPKCVVSSFRVDHSLNSLHSLYTVIAAMKWHYDSRRFTDDQVKHITDILLEIFCWCHMNTPNSLRKLHVGEEVI